MTADNGKVVGGVAFGLRVGVVTAEAMRGLLALVGDVTSDPDVVGIHVDPDKMPEGYKVEGLPLPVYRYDMLVTAAGFDMLAKMLPLMPGKSVE